MPASLPCLPPFDLLPIPSRGGEYPVASLWQKNNDCVDFHHNVDQILP